MNEDVVAVIADELAVQHLEDEVTPMLRAVARQIVRRVADAGWTFTRTTQPKEVQ